MQCLPDAISLGFMNKKIKAALECELVLPQTRNKDVLKIRHEDMLGTQQSFSTEERGKKIVMWHSSVAT